MDTTNGNIGINMIAPEHQIEITCRHCNNNSYIDINFEINIIGMLQFKCKKCKSVFNAPDVAWAKISFTNSPSHKLTITTEGNIGI